MHYLAIPKRRGSCSSCGAVFPGGSVFHASLILHEEKGECERNDYCPSCATSLSAREETSYTWKSTIPSPTQKSKQHQEKDERVLHLFKEVIEKLRVELKEGLEEQAFILALYLARRKMLTLRQEMESKGQAYLLYEVNATEEMVSVPKVSLSNLKVEQVQRTLAEQLA